MSAIKDSAAFRAEAGELDPADPRLTREGYPAPLRAVFMATRAR